MDRMFSTPAETAQGLLNFGKGKGNLSGTNMVLLGILAGVYIALAAQLATIATNDVKRFFWRRYFAGGYGIDVYFRIDVGSNCRGRALDRK